MSVGSVAIVDTWAAIAYLKKEGEAGATMRRYIKRAEAGNTRLVMSLVNLGELYYRTIQMTDIADADERLRRFRKLPIEMAPVREPLAMEAGRIKARYRISYADSFVVATARLEGGPVLTGDPEILALPREVVRTVKLVR
jgi:predicted nucleic acid-binding protein